MKREKKEMMKGEKNERWKIPCLLESLSVVFCAATLIELEMNFKLWDMTLIKAQKKKWKISTTLLRVLYLLPKVTLSPLATNAWVEELLRVSWSPVLLIFSLEGLGLLLSEIWEVRAVKNDLVDGFVFAGRANKVRKTL